MVPQLTVVDGHLYFAGHIILRVYPDGDCDSVGWPFGSDYAFVDPKDMPSVIAGDRENLAVALYDMYECGTIKERTVALPDGTAFNIDNNMPTKAQVNTEGE